MKALLAALVGAVLLVVRPAAADEVAPALERADLHVDATYALTLLDPILGVYVAFDPNPTDAIAQAACDDDGDPVVVVSEAMLRLVAQITLLGHHDRRHATSTLERYAAYLAASQAPARPLLAPPPGTFEAGSSELIGARERVVSALLFVLGRELEHHRARDLVCPHPTATTEVGDAIWTVTEQRAAAATARTIYPGDAPARDEAAMTRVLSFRGSLEEQAYDVVAFFKSLEARPARLVPSYVVAHPGSAVRLANLRAVVATKKGAP